MQSEASARTTIVAFLIVGILIIGGSILLLSTRPDPIQITINPPVPTATLEPTATPSPIQVYVTGKVIEPETQVLLPPDSRVSDAIEAAGGTTEGADLERVNLAGILRDGDQVHVPAIIDDEEVDVTLATPSGGEVVYINVATMEELEMLPGIGPTTAESIIAYREENGPFVTLDDLDNVSGIGSATLESLEGLISFD